MPTFKIANSSTNPTEWLKNYDHVTGLVTEIRDTEAAGTDYGNATTQLAVIALINSNPSNDFVGHVPPPKH